MKKVSTIILLVSCILVSCSNTPDEYFDIASLNCNLLFGFAGKGMEYELANPSVKLVDEKTLATAPMSRAEMMDAKLETVETNFEKLKGLSMNEEAKEMINASIALYEFVLPVYKNEYKQLAALYDNNSGVEQIASMEKSISEKYGEMFNKLYDTVLTTGLAYAEKHGIKVQTVSPAPSL